MPHLQNVLFDLDGTLLNTLDDLTAAVNHALATYHLPLQPAQAVRRFLGNGIRRLVEQAVPEGTPLELLDKVFDTFRTYYVAHSLDTTAPYPGIPEMLHQLFNGGIRMAIVSNKLQAAVSDLHHHFFADVIAEAIGERPTIRRKPHPDTLLAAIDALGGEKAATLYVGDSEVDLEAARRAGIPCVAVLWGFRDEAQLRAQYPDAHFARTPHDIVRLALDDAV